MPNIPTIESASQADQTRSRDRYRRVALTSLANVAARVVTVLTSFATIPMTSAYLGAERFGLWMTISSLTALFAFADLGIANGLLNSVSTANGLDDEQAIRRSVSNAFCVLSTVGLLIVLVLAVAERWLDWAAILRLSDGLARDEVRPALLAFLVCFGFGVPLGVVARTQLGLQMGFVNSLWQTAGSLMGLAAVAVVIHVQAGLPWLVASLLGGPLVAAAANSVIFFGFTQRRFRPRKADVSIQRMAILLRMGGLFLILQITVALAFASDALIAARVLGATAVGDYAIATKLFATTPMIIGMLVQPLWPAYGEALARKDFAWARRTLFRSTALAVLLATAVSTAIFLAFNPIARIWIHHEVMLPTLLLSGLAVWSVMESGATCLGMFLNGARIVKLQVVLASIFAVTCFTAKLALTSRYGLVALPWSTLASYTAVTLMPLLLLRRHWLP